MAASPCLIPLQLVAVFDWTSSDFTSSSSALSICKRSFWGTCEDSEKWMHYLVLYFKKLHFKRFPVAYYINCFFMLSLLSSFLSPYLARAPLYILRFSLCIFYEHCRKDEHFKPSIFETAPIIAKIEPEKSMSACAMNTFKNFFFLQDKVANIWCSISVLIKVKRVLTQTQIIKLRLVIAFYARERWMLCQSALWDFIGTLLSLNATSTFPMMHLICSPKFCLSIVFNFS